MPPKAMHAIFGNVQMPVVKGLQEGEDLQKTYANVTPHEHQQILLIPPMKTKARKIPNQVDSSALSELLFLANQVTSTTLEGGTLKIKVDEVVVNGINLRFENRKSGEVRAEGKTKPDVILRHILSQPGKASLEEP